MEIFIFLIPFVVAAFLLIFFRKQTTWWEYAVLIVPSILIGILMEFVFKQSNAVRKILGTQSVFVDMHRHYYTKDGDAQEWSWDGSIENSYTLSSEHDYKNKVKASRSIFKFEDIDYQQARKLGLFEYPDIVLYDQNPVLGLKIPKNQEKAMRWLNGYYGERKQFRVFVLFFMNKPEEIVEKQRSYWQGGNKNELVVCVGIDKNKNVKWCNAFSWCDSPVVGVKSRDWFMSNPVNLEKYAEYIGPIVEKEWHRKNFEDFDYLTIELTDVQYWAIIIILLIFNIVMSSWIVTNNYKNDL